MRKIIAMSVICIFTSVLLVGCGKKSTKEADATTVTTTTAEPKYQVVFKNDDGTELLNVKANKGSEIDIADPKKEATDEYTYTFTGWYKEITPVNGDKTYTAQYSRTKREYTVTFKNGTEVLSREKYTYGQVPTAPEEEPTKDSTVKCIYEFNSWQQTVATETGNYVIQGLAPVTQDVTYNAVFDEIKVNINGFIITYDSTLDGYVYAGSSTNPAVMEDFVFGDIYDDGTNGLKPIKKIDVNIFEGMDNLETVRIGKNIEELYFPYESSPMFTSSFNIKEIIVDKNNTHYDSINGDLYTEGGKELMAVYTKDRTSVVFPKTVEKVRWGAFYGASGKITEITFEGNLLDISFSAFGSYSLQGLSNSVKKITFNEGVTRIPNLLFYEFTKLETVVMANTIEEIGVFAFYNCGKLASIDIPASVNNICFYDSENAYMFPFSECDGLKNINVDANNATYKSIDGNLYSKDGKILYKYAIGKTEENFVVPNGVEEIAEEAFAYKALKTVVLPSGLKKINSNAFDGCEALTTINIPNSIEYVGSFAFRGCTALEYNKLFDCQYLGNESNTKLVLYKLLVSINSEYFISKDVKVIAANTFDNCTEDSITLYYEGTEEEWALVIKEYAEYLDQTTTINVLFNQSTLVD